MTRVGKVGLDNNRTTSVAAQSLIAGTLAGGANYLLNDHKVRFLSKNNFDFTANMSERVGRAVSESSSYHDLKNRLAIHRQNLVRFEQPILEAKVRHKEISTEVGKLISPLQGAGAPKNEIEQALENAKVSLKAQQSKNVVLENMRKMNSPEHITLKQNISSTETSIKDLGLGIAKKVNAKSALIFGAFVAATLAIYSLATHPKEKAPIDKACD